MSVYFCRVGLRMIRSSPRRTNGWGRLLVGIFLLFAAANDVFELVPNQHSLLQPSNAAEAEGMKAALIATVIVGICLLISGARARFGRAMQNSENQSRGTAGTR